MLVKKHFNGSWLSQPPLFEEVRWLLFSRRSTTGWVRWSDRRGEWCGKGRRCWDLMKVRRRKLVEDGRTVMESDGVNGLADDGRVVAESSSGSRRKTATRPRAFHKLSTSGRGPFRRRFGFRSTTLSNFELGGCFGLREVTVDVDRGFHVVRTGLMEKPSIR